ncbi:MAG: sigma 54-interacting transcriptional regulator [Longimicrobiales bacterium]
METAPETENKGLVYRWTGICNLLGNQPQNAFRRIACESDAMAECIRSATQLANQSNPVVIHGPAGTGKGLVARGIHYASQRNQEPFVELDCSSLPEDVLSREIFGDASPEGTTGILALAGRGTALLRQIHALTPSLQFRLVTALGQNPEARIVVSTKGSAGDLLASDALVAELSRILGDTTLRVPALTERDRDLVLIANEALLDYGLSRREPPKELAPESVDVLLSHTWPGNVRELLHVVTSGAERCGGQVINPDDLEIRVRNRDKAVSSHGLSIQIPENGATLEWVAEEAVRIALIMSGGNKSQASRTLGISRPTLLKKLRSLEARQAREEEAATGTPESVDRSFAYSADGLLR